MTEASLRERMVEAIESIKEDVTLYEEKRRTVASYTDRLVASHMIQTLQFALDTLQKILGEDR